MATYMEKIKEIGEPVPEEIQGLIRDHKNMLGHIKNAKLELQDVPESDTEGREELETLIENYETSVEKITETIHASIDEWKSDLEESGSDDDNDDDDDEPEPQPASQQQAPRPQAAPPPPPNRKEGSGIGWFLFATFAAVVTLGVVNAYDR